MAESKISGYLKKILSAVYGKDVRQSIHDAIMQCYDDVSNPTLNTEALEKIIQQKIDDGLMANLTIADGSITAAKLAEDVILGVVKIDDAASMTVDTAIYLYKGALYYNDGAKWVKVATEDQVNVVQQNLDDFKAQPPVIPEKYVKEKNLTDDLVSQIKSSGYITDASGKKYMVYVDNDGNLAYRELKEIPTEGLIADLCVEDGQVYESVQKRVMETYTTDGVHIWGDEERVGSSAGKGVNILPEGADLSEYSFVIQLDKDHDGFYFAANRASFYAVPNAYNGLTGGVGARMEFGNVTGSEPSVDKKNFAPLNGDIVIFSKKANNTQLQMRSGVLTTGTRKDYVNLTAAGVYSQKPQPNSRIIRLLFYNRALTEEEMYDIYEALKYKDESWHYPAKYVQGIAALGCANNIKAQSGKIPVWNDTDVEYTKVDWTEPTVTEATDKFESVFWANPIDSLAVDEIYNIEAFPYPYHVGNDTDQYLYNIEYSTSDPGVLECYNGVLIAKKAGTATITAKISNTELSVTKEITVSEAEVKAENLCYLPENYSHGLDSLTSKNPDVVMRTINNAILEVKEAGYDGVVFPKMEYHVAPFMEGRNVIVPSDFIIDFSGADMYCHDSPYCWEKGKNGAEKAGNYILFSFGTAANNGGYTPCHNSEVRNLNYYGERYQHTYPDDYYTSGCQFAAFPPSGCSNCHLRNINFQSTTGFHVTTGQSGFMVWQGTGLDGARRGCTLPEDYSAGRLADDGVTVQEDPKGMWWCTPEPLKLGYNYSDDPVEYTDMKYYCVGAMGVATRSGCVGRTYEIFFFDKDKKLIQASGLQVALERYLMPKDAVYFKINLLSYGKPGYESAVDVRHVVRIWNVGDPYRCSIENCKFLDPECSAVSWCGGYNCLMKDSYAEQGLPVALGNGRYGWSIDYEDGWLEMRHNVMYHSMCSGLIPNPGGYDTAFVDCLISSISFGGSGRESSKMINCVAGSISCDTKTNDVFNTVTYKSNFTHKVSSDVKYATTRIVNCVQDKTLTTV